MDWMKLADKIAPFHKRGEIDKCIQMVCAVLEKTKKTPFHVAVNLEFSNEPRKVSKRITQFVNECDFSVKAVYLEMNGFFLNPDRWYFDLFAYKKDGGDKDYDWLAYWNSDETKGVKLTGLERLQDLYKKYGEGVHTSERYSDTRDLCNLLILLKFQKMVRKACLEIPEIKAPVLATAHEYDIILRV